VETYSISPIPALESPEDPQPGPAPEQPRQAISHANSSMGQVSAGPSNANWGLWLFCDMPSCSAGPFTTRTWFTRHLKDLHGVVTCRLYDCPAFACPKKGGKGYVVSNSLRTHIFTSHNDDTSFSCDDCNHWFSRDLFAIHAPDQKYPSACAEYRFCPLPKCNFKVDTRLQSELDKLLRHLFTEHSRSERTVSTNRIEQIGYDSSTCTVICPVCTPKVQLSGHAQFYEHFMQLHFTGPQCARHMDGSCPEECGSRRSRMMRCTHVPHEVREARRVILRLLPAFKHYPVWDDIKCRGPPA
jgi:hypothetical protein